jgi:hypothetical protein
MWGSGRQEDPEPFGHAATGDGALPASYGLTS